MSSDIPSPRAVRRLTRRARRGHDPGALADQAGDVYMVLLAIGMVTATVVTSVHRTPAAATLRAPQSATVALLLALALLLAGAALLGLAAVGPVSAGAPIQTWQLSTPGRRAGWLTPRLGWLLGGGAAAGIVLGSALELAVARGLAPAGQPGPGRAGLAWGAGLGGLLAPTLVAVAVVGQPRGGRLIALAGRVLLGLGLLGAGVALAVTDVSSVRAHAGGTVHAAVVAAVAVLLSLGLAAAIVGAVRALPRLDRAALSTGADLSASAAVAVVGLDPSLLAGAVQLRRLRRRGRVRGRRLRASGRYTAFLAAEVRRVARHPAALLLAAGLVLLPYLASVVLPPAPVTLIRVLAGYVAAAGLAGGLRAVCRTPALRRALGGTNADLRLIHLVVPTVGAAVWLAATAPAGRSLSPAGEVLLLAGLAAAVYRTASRPPIDYDSAFATSPVGPLPIGLITQAIRGLDLALVVAALTAYWPGGGH